MATRGCRKAAFIAGIGCLSVVILLTVLVAGGFYLARSALKQASTTRSEPVSVSVPTGAAPEGPAGTLRLTIELSEGIFTIRPGPPDSDVRLDGEYDPVRYAVTQSTEDEGDMGRAISIRFHRRGFFFFGFNTETTPNHVTVTIPEGVPTALSLRISKSRSESDLGGLTLTELVSDFSTGDHKVRFDRPLQGHLPHAAFRASMGRLEVAGLGNARPADLRVQGSLSDIGVEFDGAWPSAASLKGVLRVSMGSLRVRIPEGVRVRSSSSVVFGSSRTSGMKRPVDDDPNAPTLNLELSTSMGDIRIARE